MSEIGRFIRIAKRVSSAKTLSDAERELLIKQEEKKEQQFLKQETYYRCKKGHPMTPYQTGFEGVKKKI